MMRSIIVLWLQFVAAICFVSCSCSETKQKPVFYDDDEETSYGSGGEVEVPYREVGGVKYVNVSVNGVGLEMIFDTGCSSTLISIAEANYLYNKGRLTGEDVLGTEQAQIADGSIVEDMVINLKEVIVGGKIVCNNVRATVSSNTRAPLLLGNEILNRVSSYSIDNENKKIIFNLE
jgi:predicted aspartyl protease